MVIALPQASMARTAPGVKVERYNLGRVSLDVPGPMGPLPARIWGVAGTPRLDHGSRVERRPLVIVAHGRHGDNCPAGPFDSETWPCFGREQRNELGLTYLVRALAKHGMFAIAPNLNAAFTSGWGEPDDRRRWPAIVDRTLQAIFSPDNPADAAKGRTIPGFSPARIDPRRIGILGHSLSGTNTVRWARARSDMLGDREAIRRGRGPVRSIYLLAPATGGGPPPDVPTAMMLASCDGDTGTEGRAYLRAARRDRDRRRAFRAGTLRGANHNYFNRLLARLGYDDAPLERKTCRPRSRLSAATQQRKLIRSAVNFFTRTLAGRAG